MLVLLLDLYESPLLITFLPCTEKFLSLYSSAGSMVPGRLAPLGLDTGTPRRSGIGLGGGDISEGLLEQSSP